MRTVLEYPEGFDPDEMLDSSFDIVYDDPIELKIWFSADQEREIKERTCAKEQKITGRSEWFVFIFRHSGERFFLFSQ